MIDAFLGSGVGFVDEVIEFEGRAGIIYERVEGPNMQDEFITKPWRIIELASRLAGLQAAVHECVLSDLPSHRQQLERKIRSATAIPVNERETALNALDRLPDGDALCHGDLHPFNVLMSPRGPIIIDWMDAGRGNPLADVAKTSLVLRLRRSVPDISVAAQVLMKAARNLIHAVYLNRYRYLRCIDFHQLAAWQTPIAASRLSAGIAGEQTQLLALIEDPLPH